MKIGIYNQEIFIEQGSGYGVLRVVPKDVLEDLRSVECLINYGEDDLWRQAVAAGQTELGLREWLEEAIDELEDDEDFFCKDDSYLEYLSEEQREAADKYMLDTYGIEVGTWECSGWYMPEGECEFDLTNI